MLLCEYMPGGTLKAALSDANVRQQLKWQARWADAYFATFGGLAAMCGTSYRRGIFLQDPPVHLLPRALQRSAGCF